MGTKNLTPEPAPERFGQLPLSRGIVFVCRNCRRPTATHRDSALRAWGERGMIAEASKRLRCPGCRKRGMDAYLAPRGAGLGSPTPLDKLVQAILALRPSGRVE
jgi:hypothetical protein